MPQVKVKRMGAHDLPFPVRATKGSAGMDVRACSDGENPIKIYSGCTVVIKTGFAYEFNDEHCMKVYARSGLSIKQDLGLANGVGVIDSDYRGELLVALHNHGPHMRVIEHGERIAQIMVEKLVPWGLTEFDELSETERGTGGLGSTGTVS